MKYISKILTVILFLLSPLAYASQTYSVNFYNDTDSNINVEKIADDCMYQSGPSTMVLEPHSHQNFSIEDKNSFSTHCYKGTKTIHWTYDYGEEKKTLNFQHAMTTGGWFTNFVAGEGKLPNMGKVSASQRAGTDIFVDATCEDNAHLFDNCLAPAYVLSSGPQTLNVHFKDTPDAFSVIMSGDTQYARIHVPTPDDPKNEKSCGTGSSAAEKDCQEKAATQISHFFESMATLKTKPEGKNLSAVFINGDLTEYGHKSQMEGFTSLLAKGVSKIRAATAPDEEPVHFFLGLGNHDISNNYCARNNCATRMFNFMWNAANGKPWSGGVPISNMDIKGAHNASLAYSEDIHGVHFVQLNNYPTFSRDWKTGGGVHYNVYSSLDWLEKDLQAARERQEPIIISFHDPSQSFNEKDPNISRFKALLEKYQVSAVFAAHFH